MPKKCSYRRRVRYLNGVEAEVSCILDEDHEIGDDSTPHESEEGIFWADTKEHTPDEDGNSIEMKGLRKKAAKKKSAAKGKKKTSSKKKISKKVSSKKVSKKVL